MKKTTYTINNQSVTVYLRDEADESVAAEIFKLHEYRMAEEAIRNAVLPIVDVGAHSGMFTMFARALNPKVAIVAVEPEAANIVLLKEHFQENGIRNVHVVEGALAGSYGKRRLQVSSDSHNHTLTDSTDKKTTIVVQGYDVAHLQTYFPEGVSLLKMDIEGGEYEFFEKTPAADLQQIHAVIMEYHDLPGKKHAIVEAVLRENGFGVQSFPSKFDKNMGFLWATNKRIKRG